MTTNRDLLKEAIADAKAVKETAIANAKLALEETFNPYLRERLAAKLTELDEEMDDTELNEMEEDMMDENYSEEDMMDEAMDEMGEMDETEMATEGDTLDLEALLRELDGLEEDATINPNDNHGNIKSDSLNEAEDEAEDADVNIEDMSTEDLESFIKDVISDMVSAGELEAGHEEGEEEMEMGDEEMEMGDEEMDIDMDMEDGDEEEVDIEEMVAEIKRKKVTKKEDDEDKKVKEMKKELEEAYSALKTIKSELNEVNLFNAKLLYTNKIFRNKNLSENQKVKVLAAFDKAASIKEAKLVYETLSEGIKTSKKPVNESLLRGAASKVSGIAPKKPILEVNDQVSRWQLLAGITKKQ
jgi:hypothetical protein